ncbi:hypothetical protein OS21_49500 [Dickeya oryzae]
MDLALQAAASSVQIGFANLSFTRITYLSKLIGFTHLRLPATRIIWGIYTTVSAAKAAG